MVGFPTPAEDLYPVSEVEAGVNCRLAGRVRRQVVGHTPGRRLGPGTANLDYLSVEWRKRGSYDTAWVTPGARLSV